MNDIGAIAVGDRAIRTFEFSTARVQKFAELIDDFAPVHFDSGFARGRGYQERIVHGLFVASVISGMLGTEVPGPNSVINSLNMKMHAAAPVGSSVTYELEVTAITVAVGAVTLIFKGYLNDGTLIISGKVLCSFRA